MRINKALVSYFSTYQYYSEITKARASGNKIKPEISAKKVLRELDKAPFKKLLAFALEMDDKIITKDNVRQFSSLENATDKMTDYLYAHPYGVGFEELGRVLQGKTEITESTARKYGSEQAGLAKELDLVYFMKSDGSVYVYLSDLGMAMAYYPLNKQKELYAKLMLFMPEIHTIFKKANKEEVIIEDWISEVNGISGETIPRRASSVRTIIKEIKAYAIDTQGIAEALLTKPKKN